MGVLYLLSAGSCARKAGPRIVVEKNSEIVGRLPIRSIDGVVVGRNAQISTQTIFELIELHVPIFYIDGYGKIVGHFVNEKLSTTRLFRQLEIFRDPDRQLALSREIIAEKISNQRDLLKRYEKTVDAEKLELATKKLKQTVAKLSSFETLDELRGAEGLTSKIYFATFSELLDQNRWKWKERSQHPARDPVNALLNYGYAFLEREVRIAVALSGMDARIGFFHSNNGRKDSLIFDLMELFRQPVIDRFVLSLLNKKMIQPENFSSTPEECRLNEDGRIIFCTRYEEYMAKIYREYGDKNSRDLIVERVKKFSACLNR
ncbi:MAG: CRISPR-associated endonuclease Cas1 [Selenomonadaceae bacterium]|nr:CRISPR-associated endonuclease Cas1 [Selenomonadaceae bacterium]